MAKNTIFPAESAPECQFHLVKTADQLIAQNRFSEAATLALESERLLAGDYNENPLAVESEEAVPSLVLMRIVQ
ncbi:MAG: hypothetical protein WC851_00075 [Candidatus Shapirobacteria bacterium]|jgi:hypothetical protein